jgi:hypothetical protein
LAVALVLKVKRPAAAPGTTTLQVPSVSERNAKLVTVGLMAL